MSASDCNVLTERKLHPYYSVLWKSTLVTIVLSLPASRLTLGLLPFDTIGILFGLVIIGVSRFRPIENRSEDSYWVPPWINGISLVVLSCYAFFYLFRNISISSWKMNEDEFWLNYLWISNTHIVGIEGLVLLTSIAFLGNAIYGCQLTADLKMPNFWGSWTILVHLGIILLSEMFLARIVPVRY